MNAPPSGTIDYCRWKSFPALATTIAFSLLTVCNELAYALIADTLHDLPEHKSAFLSMLSRYRIGMHLCTALALTCVVLALHYKQLQMLAERAAMINLEQERASLEKVVAMRTQRLSELATHLQDAREAERRHLAREMHDEMGALFTAAKLDVVRIRRHLDSLPCDVQLRFDQLAQTLDTGIMVKRRIIEELRPSALTSLGLASTLQSYLQELATRSGMHIRFSIDPPKLSERGELTAFRLVQEALNNTIKHANAKHVAVTVSHIDAAVQIEIQDDGVGFDPSIARPEAHGLHGMAHRVEVLGGAFNIQSQPGGGTVITARFPAHTT